jgi:hypothetical protein
MKNEFVELIKNNGEEKYVAYLEKMPEMELKGLSKKIIDILQVKNLEERSKKWKDFEIKLSEIKNLHLLCNPYYIGYGNPNSEILFLGKEKAFDITNSPDLFLHESINNNIQWECLIENCNTNLEFNPLFPQKYFGEKFKIKHTHTWGMYHKLVKGITENPNISSELGVLENNFFNHCFTTEVNHIPSKYSSNLKSIDPRKELLQHAFYKSFKYVIIGAIGAIDPIQIKEIFGDLRTNEVQLNKEGSKKERKIEVFQNDTQKIILCNQLSGAAGWSNEEIANLINEIKEN